MRRLLLLALLVSGALHAQPESEGVILQSSSPGMTQIGNIHISGALIAGSVNAPVSGIAAFASASDHAIAPCAAHRFVQSMTTTWGLGCVLLDASDMPAMRDVNIDQGVNGSSAIYGQRATDISSSGYLINYRTGPESLGAFPLFRVDSNGVIVTGEWRSAPVLPAYGGSGIDASSVAKGGTIAGTGPGTFGIQATCPNGQHRVADSTQTTGWKCDATVITTTNFTDLTLRRDRFVGDGVWTTKTLTATSVGFFGLTRQGLMQDSTSYSTTTSSFTLGSASVSGELYEITYFGSLPPSVGAAVQTFTATGSSNLYVLTNPYRNVTAVTANGLFLATTAWDTLAPATVRTSATWTAGTSITVSYTY